MKSYSSKDLKRCNHLLGEIEAVYHEMALKFSLSDSIMGILYTICDEGDSCLLQDISRRSGMSKQTVNSALRKLEAEKMIYLEAAGARSKSVCLTEKGKALAKRTAIPVIEAENEILASWPHEDVEKYLDLMERFLMAIREKSQNIEADAGM